MVCHKCTILGPHNNKLHRILEMAEAFRQRQGFLQRLVCEDLLAKRDLLARALVAIEENSEELKLRKYRIEREVKKEYSETLDRLKEAEGVKLAILHHEMGDLQRDLEAINTLGNDFFFYTNRQPAGMISDNAKVAFLVKERSMREKLEELISKPFKQAVDVYPYDLPREVAEKRLLLEKAARANSKLSLKNEVIWGLLQKVKEKEQEIRRETEIAVFEEMEEWKKLKGKLESELAPF